MLTGRAWPIAYRVDEVERGRILCGFGVGAFTALVYPHKPGMAYLLNECATFAAATPDCLPSATVFPEPGAGEEGRRAIDASARLFKAHVQVGDYYPNDPLRDDAWGVLAESRTPAVIHVSHGPAPGRFTGPDGIGRLLRRFPDLMLIIAHLGSAPPSTKSACRSISGERQL